MKEIHLIYYSPALSTRKIMRMIGEATGLNVKEHDITMGLDEDLSFTPDDFVMFGIPVYAGRVPSLAVETLSKVKGNQTPSILACVYGNRDYDDALLELKDLSVTNGFIPIAAGAFIARHSIFPDIAQGRPDAEDEQYLISFGEKCLLEYQSYKNKKSVLTVKGNFPYREPSKIPFAPKGDSSCDKCGTCVKMCPVHAIPADNPRKTDKNLCISCARCIAVCPKQSRRFKGLLYKAVKRKFKKSYSVKREPDTFFL